MKIIDVLFIVIFSLFISSCAYEGMVDSMAPKEERLFAENYLSKLRKGEFEYIKAYLDDTLIPQVNNSLLQKMSGLFRDGNLISTELVGVQVNIVDGEWRGNFSFEYQFENGWNLANAEFRKINGFYKVTGLNVYQTGMSQKEVNAFTLSNKGTMHYVILSLAVLVPAFILLTAYRCVRTPMLKRKWLWVIFILVGIFSIQINWTSGEYEIIPLSFLLFGASATAMSPYSPWVVSAAFPLGAIFFRIKRKKFIELSS